MADETWNARAKNAFFMYSIYLNIVGVWPFVPQTLLLKCRVIGGTINLIIGACGEILRLLIDCGTKESIIDSFLSIAFFVQGACKSFSLYLNRRKLKIVFNSAFNDWEIIKNKRYVNMMLEDSIFNKKLAKWFYVIGYSTLGSHLGKALIFDKEFVEFNCDAPQNLTCFKMSRRYPLPGGCVYDNYSSNVYYTVLFNQAIQLILITSVLNGCDSLYVAITNHLCTQCQILKIELSKFGKLPDFEMNRMNFERLAARHQHLMGISTLLEDIFNPIILTQMAVTVVIVSIAGYSFLVYLNVGNIIGATKALTLIIFLLLQSYIYTYPADNLQCQSEELKRSLYDSQWYEMPANIMRNVIFMMMRINSPPYYTAGKFFYMTRVSYMVVIKTAASYLSVLRIMLR